MGYQAENPSSESTTTNIQYNQPQSSHQNMQYAHEDQKDGKYLFVGR